MGGRRLILELPWDDRSQVMDPANEELCLCLVLQSSLAFIEAPMRGLSEMKSTFVLPITVFKEQSKVLETWEIHRDKYRSINLELSNLIR